MVLQQEFDDSRMTTSSCFVERARVAIDCIHQSWICCYQLRDDETKTPIGGYSDAERAWRTFQNIIVQGWVRSRLEKLFNDGRRTAEVGPV